MNHLKRGFLKHGFVGILVSLIILPSLQAQSVQPDFDLEKIAESDMRQHQWEIESTTWKQTEQEHTDPFDITHYTCIWTVDPEIHFISGTIITRFFPLSSDFDTIHFMMDDVLILDSIEYHGQSLGWLHTNDIIKIPLPAPIPTGMLDSIAITYHGIPPSSGFGSFNTGTHNGSPILWTLSEPYGASDWWPCKNTLTDKADSLDVLITVPSGNDAASNGILIEESTSGDKTTFHWRHRFPIVDYLICLAVTDYSRYSDWVPFDGTLTEVTNWVYPEDSAAIVPQTAVTVPVMQVFDTLFGVYPFHQEKYGHCQFNQGGGMEHQTFTFMGSFGIELISHELAHQWFGDMVTCGSWADIWLNEGFATYLSGLTYEYLFDGLWWMPFKKDRINKVTSKPGGSVYCDDTTSVARIFDSRLSYAKGAMILHQLRWIIGDSAWYAAVNHYLYDPALQFDFARTHDLKTHFEATSGEDLTWYFDDWYYGEGYPTYEIRWEQTGSTVSITVDQTQSTSSVEFFELPLPVMLKNDDSDTTIRLNHGYSGQTFQVEIPFQADSLIFDPELWLITRNNTINSSEDTPEAPRVMVYPNPFQHLVNIAFEDPTESIAISLYNSNGVLVHQSTQIEPTTYSIDLEDFPNGIYLICIVTESYSITQKIIKQP